MENEMQDIFVAATKIHTWSKQRWGVSCASCGAGFDPDVVLEAGKPVGHWVGFMWSESSGCFSPSNFCWGCAGLFMTGEYRGADNDYEVDLGEFADAIRRVVRRERHRANNPQDSDYPVLMLKLRDNLLREASRLEEAHVVDHRVFNRECRVGWPYA